MITRRSWLASLSALLPVFFVAKSVQASDRGAYRAIRVQYDCERGTRVDAIEYAPSRDYIRYRHLRTFAVSESERIGQVLRRIYKQQGKPTQLCEHGQVCYFDTPANRAAIMAA